MLVCPVCSRKVVSELDLGIGHCRFCDHKFQMDLTIRVKYDKSYVDYYSQFRSSEISHLRLGLLQAFCQSGILLDVGYGNGAFASLAQRAGYEVFGYEVHGQDFGIPHAEMDYHYWDVVTFFDSLEHFSDLSFLGSLQAKCLMISIPNRPRGFPEVCKKWRHFKPGEHLHYFNLRSLEILLTRMQCVWSGHLEDIVRVNDEQGDPNILTTVWVEDDN